MTAAKPRIFKADGQWCVSSPLHSDRTSSFTAACVVAADQWLNWTRPSG